MRLKSVWYDLTTSFWFVPIVSILVAFAGAYVSIFIDSSVDIDPPGFFQHILCSNVDSARSVLSTISGAMIGVAGTVFSITLVALTLASSQFGSRLLRNFMHDRTNQVVLGSYIATFVYCLIILNAIDEGVGFEFVPEISVLISIVAAVANIVLLVIFIHHISMGIQADKVISDISTTLNLNLNTIFPDEIQGDEVLEDALDLDELKKGYEERYSVRAPRGGYLQYVNYDTTLSAAKEGDLLVIVNFRPGDHVVFESPVIEVCYNGDIPEKSIRRLETAFLVGNVRTPYQDAEFSIHQMVEIAARALSPGVNDPYTAIACVDNLTSTLCHLTRVKFPLRYRYDDDAEDADERTVRVIADVLTFEGMLNAAFNQIRQFAGGSPAVLIRLMESLVTIHQFVRTDQQKQAVQKHMRMVYRMAEHSFVEESDLIDLKERIKAIVRDF
ncbi:MAG: DUF2254 domain-containing protein [Euryarchaeota archaeon]|nr:DUF2254 domain-containing protein [Euryarchaeota archaeon]